MGSAALLALAPGMAWAVGETVVTYTGSPDTGATVSVKAAAGKANRISVKDKNSAAGVVYVIQDTAAGVTESSPHCSQPSPTEIRCPTEGFRGLTLLAGDLADVVIVTNRGIGDRSPKRARTAADHGETPIVGFGGRGKDRLTLTRGRGTLKGQVGRDTLEGGTGPQRIFGGRGNDLVTTAGPGRDLCNGGRGIDRLRDPSSCEKRFFFDIPAERLG